MHTVSQKRTINTVDLRQHFQNYFELLLGVERTKLQQAIEKNGESPKNDLLIEIDFRINYLRGALRMGKLLCLINQEEAKSNLSLLSTERERLRGYLLTDSEDIPKIFESGESGSRRAQSIRESLRRAG